jgi:hypothetical protein
MIPQISHSEYQDTIKEEYYYETTEILTEGEKKSAADLSKCSVHELRATAPIFLYAYRCNSKLLRKTYDRDFVAIMSHKYPEWNPTEWAAEFTPVRSLRIEKEEQKRCICGHWIQDCCIWRHDKTRTYILVGNVCIKKISKTAYRDMLSCVKKQKEREAEYKRWKQEKQEREQYEREIKERDDLVARIEQEQDDHMEMVVKMNQLKQRLLELETQMLILSLRRTCQVCNTLSIKIDAPAYFTKCLPCFKNGDC